MKSNRVVASKAATLGAAALELTFMKKQWIGAFMAAAVALALSVGCRADEIDAQQTPVITASRLRVAMLNGQVWIRSTLSPTQELVVLTAKGANNQFMRMAQNAPLLAAGMNEPPVEQARCLLNGL